MNRIESAGRGRSEGTAALGHYNDNQMLMHATGFRGIPGIDVQESDGLIRKFNGMPQPGQMVEVLGER